VRREGSGDVVAVPGAATLQVSLLNPISSTFDKAIATDGYPTLRSVVYAGDFEASPWASGCVRGCRSGRSR